MGKKPDEEPEERNPAVEELDDDQLERVSGGDAILAPEYTRHQKGGGKAE